jgi:hypothetical protein
MRNIGYQINTGCRISPDRIYLLDSEYQLTRYIYRISADPIHFQHAEYQRLSIFAESRVLAVILISRLQNISWSDIFTGCKYQLIRHIYRMQNISGSADVGTSWKSSITLVLAGTGGPSTHFFRRVQFIFLSFSTKQIRYIYRLRGRMWMCRQNIIEQKFTEIEFC